MTDSRPKLVSYERHNTFGQSVVRSALPTSSSASFAHVRGELSSPHVDYSRAPVNGHTQRSFSFQRRGDRTDRSQGRQVGLRRASNSVAPIPTMESSRRDHAFPDDWDREQRERARPAMGVGAIYHHNNYQQPQYQQQQQQQHGRPAPIHRSRDSERSEYDNDRDDEVNGKDPVYQTVPNYNGGGSHYGSPSTYAGPVPNSSHYLKQDKRGHYYDELNESEAYQYGGQETDILDDASDAQSDFYQAGYHGDEAGSSSEGEVDDPEFNELLERENIVDKYNKGPDQVQIDEWENPQNEFYTKADRFGFVHKEEMNMTAAEREERKRIQKELLRDKKWITMLNEWSKSKNKQWPKKLEERIWKGVPKKLRMVVWPKLLKADDFKAKNPNMYTELLLRARLVSKDIKQIDLDINRTYRDHQFFRRRYDVKQRSLLNVLTAYSMYNTEVGYCQGMSQIAALFLMFLDEEDTFWCLHALMVNPRHTMHGFFVPGFPKLTRFETHFIKILKKYRRRVFKHLEKQDIPYIYLTKWWFGCFLDRVPFSLALRVWDVYLVEGDALLLAMALNIMKMHEKRILSLQIDTFMEFIQQAIATDFGFSDDEVIYSLREQLHRLRSDRLHLPASSKDGDLSEVPTKALGPILRKPLASIRDEIHEIQSRHSLAVSMSKSPRSGRKNMRQIKTASGTPVVQSRKNTSGGTSDIMHSSSPSTVFDNSHMAHNRQSSVPYKTSSTGANTPPPDPRHYSSNTKRNGAPGRIRQQMSAHYKDERTGQMVTVLRDEDEQEDFVVVDRHGQERRVMTGLPAPSSPLRVVQAADNVTYIRVGDDDSSQV